MRLKWPITLIAVLLPAVVVACHLGPTVPGSGSMPAASLSVHVIDVGQAEAILVLTAEKSMLIDGGARATTDLVQAYLRSQGVERLDIVIGTHPHEDHIGGLVEIIKDFPVDKIYMPRVAHTTKTYEDLMRNIKTADLKVIPVKPELKVDLGADITGEFLSPAGSSYHRLNNYSAVLKLTYQKTSFLFTGDAELEAERELLASGVDLASTVLKVAHHGSNSSTTTQFLRAVKPRIALISVGKGNDYGYPHKEVINRLQQADTLVFRTDVQGTVVLTSDGRKVTVVTEKDQDVKN